MDGALAFAGRWRSLLVVAGVVVVVTLLRPYKKHPAIYSDGVGYHLWTRAVLDRDLSFRRYAGREGTQNFLLPAPRAGVYRNQFPPGVALLRLPVMVWLVGKACDGPLVSRAEHTANLVLSALALVGTCFLCLRVGRLLGIEPAASHAALLALVFGTGLFHYGTYDGCFSHVYSALAGTLLLWLGVRALVSRQEALPPLLTGLLCFLLPLIRNTNVLLLAGLAVPYFVVRGVRGPWVRRRVAQDAIVLLSGCAAASALQLAYNAYIFGQFTLSSYGDHGFAWDRPMQAAVLFSYERGLFTYYPVVAVVLLAGLLVRRTRPWTAWFTAVLAVYATLYGFWVCWTLGASFGYRGFVELMPAAAVLFAAALGELRGVRRTALTAAAALCTLVTLQLLVGYWTWRLAGEHVLGSLYWRHVVGADSVFRFLY
jgi:hypothetical protein